MFLALFIDHQRITFCPWESVNKICDREEVIKVKWAIIVLSVVGLFLTTLGLVVELTPYASVFIVTVPLLAWIGGYFICGFILTITLGTPNDHEGGSGLPSTPPPDY